MRGFEPRTYGLRNQDNSGQMRTQADSGSRLRVVDGAGQGQTRPQADTGGSRVAITHDAVADALKQARTAWIVNADPAALRAALFDVMRSLDLDE